MGGPPLQPEQLTVPPQAGTGWGALLRHRVSRNAGAVLVASAVGQLFSFLTFPYLTRVLGVDSYGAMAFCLSFASWPALLVDFGFTFSATREVAALQDQPSALAQAVGDVQGAKLLLGIAGGLVGGAAVYFVPSLRAYPRCAVFALLYAIGTGLTPSWFLNGLQWMRVPAIVQAVQLFINSVAVFMFVHGPADAWKVLLVYAVGSWAVCAVLTFHAYRRVAWRPPRFAGACAALRQGLGLLVFRGSVTLYTAANVFLLGLLLPVGQVALFAAPERLIRRLLAQVADPTSQALFPEMSNRMRSDPHGTKRTLRRLVAFTIGGGTAVAALMAWAAPLIVRILMGPSFMAAVPVLRVTSLLILLIPPNIVLGVQWLIPERKDWHLNVVIASAAAANVALALVLVPRFGPIGMAWSVVAAETIVALGTLRLTIWARPSRAEVPA